MKQSISLLTFVLFSIFALAQNPNPSSTVDDFILDEMLAENIPGMATLIVKDGEIVWVNGYGFADVGNSIAVTDSTVFMLASISKVFTGTALMLLHEDGLIDLDEDINNHLPFNIDVPGFASDSITFRQLMTHTSSIADNDPVMDTYYSSGDPTITLADLMQRYFSTSGSDYSATQNFSNAQPGTLYQYSNMGTALAGYMVEAVTGTDFSDYCNTHIFDRLCMNSTSWYLADFDTNTVARPYQWTGGQFFPYAHYGFADYPDGQLRSTVKDLAHFIIAYLQDGTYHGQWLASTTIDEMLSPQVPSLEPAQGLNWYTEDIYLSGGGTVALWGHNGGESGVSTDMYIDRDNNIGVAVLSNGEGDNLYVVDELYNYALTLSASGAGNLPCQALSTSNAAERTILDIFPNPSQGVVQLRFGEVVQDGTLRIHNALGALVATHSIVNTSSVQLTLPDIPGLYTLHVTSSNGPRHIGRMIRE